MDTFKDTSTFKQQLNKFIVDNGIIGTTAGVGVGLATTKVIQSFIGDVVFPAFHLLAFKLNISYFSKKHVIHYANFLKEFITWIVILVITFVFVQISFKVVLGVGNDENILKKNDKKDK